MVGERPSHTVLAVDDDEDILTALLFFLESVGFDVEGTTSSAEALERLQEGYRPCALLVDVVMPDFDGWMLVERLRADPALRDIPVVLYSGARPDEERCRALGVSAFLMKPTMPEAVAEALAEHCTHGRTKT